MLNFWGPKKYKKVINSSTKCLISVKIAIMTPHIIPLVNVWLIFDLHKYVNWLCVFSKVNPFFQKAQVFCMDLQPAADPYNVVCSSKPCLWSSRKSTKTRINFNTEKSPGTSSEAISIFTILARAAYHFFILCEPHEMICCMNFAHDVWYPQMKTNHTCKKMYFNFQKFIYRWQYPQGGDCYRKLLKGKVVGLRNKTVVARHVAQLSTQYDSDFCTGKWHAFQILRSACKPIRNRRYSIQSDDFPLTWWLRRLLKKISRIQLSTSNTACIYLVPIVTQCPSLILGYMTDQ